MALPQFTCPTNKVVQCGTAWTFDPPIFGIPCHGIGSLQVDTQTNGSGCAETITRTWVLFDNCTNFFTCSQTVTISEIPPCVASYTWSTLAGQALSVGTADGTGNAARFNYPFGVAVDLTGNLYVARTATTTPSAEVTPSGVVTTLAGLAGNAGSTDGIGSAARFYHPASNGVAVDSAGNVYVADTGNDTIRKITPDGGVTTLAGNPGTLGAADGMGSAASFDAPWGVAVDSAGTVYVADTGSGTIRKVTPDGAVTTLAGSAYNSGSADGTGNAARFGFPTGLTADIQGNLYVGGL